MVTCAPTSKALWEQMSNLYGQESNLGRIFEIKRQIADIKKEEKIISQLFGDYEDLWNEYNTLRPITTDLKVLRQQREEDMIFGLLMSLEESYAPLRQEILRMKNFPPYQEVRAMIQRTAASMRLEASQSKGHVFTIDLEEQKANKVQEAKNICGYCKKPNHTKEKCWRLHPHLRPDHLKKKDQSSHNSAKIATLEIAINDISKLLKEVKTSLNDQGSQNEQGDW
ncbi:uncharacterized protein LOC141844855 [Curcuma longa]|uniref:uncharacterized protein LOC141844855 n=1 Tax=Curcuma longa TaxID=136217 RepID=UPI003D9FA4B1